MSSEDRREPGGGLSGESLSSLRKLGYASRASCTRLIPTPSVCGLYSTPGIAGAAQGSKLCAFVFALWIC
jgi:hypothetical protein